MSKKKKIAIILISVLAALIITATLCMVCAWTGILSKDLDNDGTAYRILQISDMHLRNDSRDKRQKETITMMVNESRPDKIVVTGDISSNHVNEPDFRHAFDFIDSFGIDWTFTFGNHDTEGIAKKERVIEMMSQYDNCSFPKITDNKSNVKENGTFEATPTYEEGFEYGLEARPEVVEQKINEQDSRGNYYDYAIDKDGNKLMSLFYMDSNMYAKDGYASFRDEQIDWYSKSVDAINTANGKNLPSLAFFHIPMREFETAHKEGKKLGGLKMEGVFGPVIDDQMFETMLEKGSTKACFVGHDHMNSYVAEYKGIKLAYAYTSDHTIYLAPQLGGRIINIKSDSTFNMQAIYRFRGIGELIIENPIK